MSKPKRELSEQQRRDLELSMTDVEIYYLLGQQKLYQHHWDNNGFFDLDDEDEILKHHS